MKKEYEPSESLKFITNNKKVISVLAIVFYIAIIVIAYFLYKKNLEYTNLFSQILGGTFVVGGLVVSVLQYTASNVEASIIMISMICSGCHITRGLLAFHIPLYSTITHSAEVSSSRLNV